MSIGLVSNTVICKIVMIQRSSSISLTPNTSTSKYAHTHTPIHSPPPSSLWRTVLIRTNEKNISNSCYYNKTTIIHHYLIQWVIRDVFYSLPLSKVLVKLSRCVTYMIMYRAILTNSAWNIYVFPRQSFLAIHNMNYFQHILRVNFYFNVSVHMHLLKKMVHR